MEHNTEAEEAVFLVLARHQLRREQGIPTLGVLIGTAEEAEAVWRRWARTADWCEAVSEADDGQDEDASKTAVLHVCRTPAGLAQTVARLGRKLEAADTDQIRQPLALTVSSEAAARFLNEAPWDRTRTFFAEGTIFLAETAKADRAPEATVIPSLAEAAPSLSGRTLRAATVTGFEAARTSFRRVAAGLADAEETDRARSAAERFLADLLEELPETRGLFELNARLDFCFGIKRAEVDLFAAGLKLAVEIDGYYHFRDQEGYRRDRRKDALLQRRGYLVLRFLAEDVVARLEEILEEIRATVAFRRATRR